MLNTTTFLGREISKDAIVEAINLFEQDFPETSAYDDWLDNPKYKYALLYEGKPYPCKQILSLATGFEKTQFSGGENTNRVFRSLGFWIVNKEKVQALELLIDQEGTYRSNLWKKLPEVGGPSSMLPEQIRSIGLYSGQQGIWRDKVRTHLLNEDGVTLSILHKGEAYADDLLPMGILYHYPKTQRPGRFDIAEINATKLTREMGLPLFVIAAESPNAKTRDVHLGWVEDWDDDDEVFLIVFSEVQPVIVAPEETAFSLVEEHSNRQKTKLVNNRLGQQRFKNQVMRRYGRVCAVCGIRIPEVIDAAHIRPRAKKGSNDPQNGMPLCALHHRAFDNRLFSIEPHTLKIVVRDDRYSLEDLRITLDTIDHLPNKPHIKALEWLWKE